MVKNEFYDYIIKVLSISRIGLVFSKDPYAIENYQELQDLSMKMLDNFENLQFDKPSLFKREIYPTPNISVRTIIVNDKNEVLLVRESKDNLYSLPGGWCDLYDSPSEAAIKECKQEAGVDVKIVRLIGITERTPYKSNQLVPEYLITFLGKAISSLSNHCHETNDVRYFPMDQLPTMSRKTSLEEIKRLFDAIENNQTIFD